MPKLFIKNPFLIVITLGAIVTLSVVYFSNLKNNSHISQNTQNPENAVAPSQLPELKTPSTQTIQSVTQPKLRKSTPSPTPSSSSTTSSSSNSSGIDPCSELPRSSYDTTVLADKPVAYFPLNVKDNICDHTDSHYFALTHGSNLATTLLPNGDNALAFSGKSDYVHIPDASGLSPATTGKFTVEAWIRPDELQFTNQEGSGYIHWLGKGTPNQHEYTLRMYSLVNDESRPNRVSGYSFNPSGGLGVGSYYQDSISSGEWMHVVFVINTLDTSGTYPTGYTKIYRDGAQRDQDSLSALSIVPVKGNAPLRIGTRDLNSFFHGAIGKVAIYNYELSPFQVLNHYQSMVPPIAGTATFEQNVGKVSTKTAGTTMQITVTNQVPVGNTLIARVVQDYSASAPTITDSRGNTYTRDRTAPNSGNTIRASIFSSPITTALEPGDTITVTTASVTARAAVIDEFSGLLTASVVDQQNGTSGESTTPGTTISITTTNDNDLILGFVAVEGPLEDTYTEDALGQFSSLPREGTDSGDADTNVTINGGYKSVGTTGTYQYKPTLDPSRKWISFLLSYKAQ